MADYLTSNPHGCASGIAERGAPAESRARAGPPAAVSPAWGAVIRGCIMLVLGPYMHAAYRIRGWGRLPFRRGPTLVVSNHLHDLDIVTLALRLSLRGPWRHPVFIAARRRHFEPGFMATRAPRLERWLRRSDWSSFFRLLGMLPIESDLRTRPIASWAWSVSSTHGDLRIAEVFEDAARQVLGIDRTDALLSDVFASPLFRRAQARIGLEALREPYRTEVWRHTRRQIEEDIALLQDVVRSGGTLLITPEGACSPDGRLQRLRAALWRLLPLGRVYLAPISYDPFVGRRLSILYRVLPAPEGTDVATALSAARPVTTSQVVARWVSGMDPGEAFSAVDLAQAASAQVASLRGHAFVDPLLCRHPSRMTAAALAGLVRIGVLRPERGRYVLRGRRAHPKFPWVTDIIAHQANLIAETCDALTAVTPGVAAGGRS